MANIAINGFGRIGRMFFRQAFSEKGSSFLGRKGINIVAINDLGDVENLAYLLKYDSVYGTYDKEVKAENGALKAGNKKIQCLQVKDPTALPWKELGIDIVVESTGVFESFEKARAHITQGAKRVVLSAPAKDEGGEGKTILMGINDGEIKSTVVTSNASCTTNAAAPVIQILSETIGIKKAILSTVHGYTATQNLVDGPTKGKDFRRGRGAAESIVPSTTGAAISVAKVVRELDKKFDGVAMRVPVPAGSVADITFIAKRPTTVEEVNSILEKAAGEKRWEGILKVTREQLVSADIVGEPFGAIADLNFTKVVDGDLVKVLSWYDNEWGYVATLLKHVEAAAKLIN